MRTHECMQTHKDEELARKLQEEEYLTAAQPAGEGHTVNTDHDQQLARLLQEEEITGGVVRLPAQT